MIRITILLLLLSIKCTAQPSFHKKPLDSIQTYNYNILGVIQEEYALYDIDTIEKQTDSYILVQKYKSGDKKLAIAFTCRIYDKEPDYERPGNWAISEISIDGHFTSLIKLYRMWYDPKVDEVSLSKQGYVQYNRELKGLKFFSKGGSSGMWRLNLRSS